MPPETIWDPDETIWDTPAGGAAGAETIWDPPGPPPRSPARSSSISPGDSFTTRLSRGVTGAASEIWDHYKQALAGLGVGSELLTEGVSKIPGMEQALGPRDPSGWHPAGALPQALYRGLSEVFLLPSVDAQGQVSVPTPGGRTEIGTPAETGFERAVTGAGERLGVGGIGLAADPANALIPGSPKIAAVFLPSMIEGAGRAGKAAFDRWKTSGFALDEHWGALLADAGLAGAFLALGGAGAAELLPGRARRAAAEQLAQATAREAAAMPPEGLPQGPAQRLGAELEQIIPAEALEQAPQAPAPPTLGPDFAEPPTYNLGDLSFLPEPVREPAWAQLKSQVRAWEQDRTGIHINELLASITEGLDPRHAEPLRQQAMDLVVSRATGETFREAAQAEVGDRAPERILEDPKTGALVEIHTAAGDPLNAWYVTRGRDGEITAGALSHNGETALIFGGERVMDMPDYTLADGTKASGVGPIRRTMVGEGVAWSDIETPAGRAMNQRDQAKRSLAPPPAGALLDTAPAPSDLVPGEATSGRLQPADRGGLAAQGLRPPAGAPGEPVPGPGSPVPGAGPAEQQLGAGAPPAQGILPGSGVAAGGGPGVVSSPLVLPPLASEAGVFRLNTPDFPSWWSARYGKDSPAPPPPNPSAPPTTHQEALYQIETQGVVRGAGGQAIALPQLQQTLARELSMGSGPTAGLARALAAAHPGLDPQAVLPALQELGLVRLIEPDIPVDPLAPPPPGSIIRQPDPGAAGRLSEVFGQDSPVAAQAGRPTTYTRAELTPKGQDPASWAPGRASTAQPAPPEVTPPGFDALHQARVVAARGESMLDHLGEELTSKNLRTKFIDRFTPIYDMAKDVQEWIERNAPSALKNRPGFPHLKLPGRAEVRLELSTAAAATEGRAEVFLHQISEIAKAASPKRAGPKVSAAASNLIELYSWKRAITEMERRAGELRTKVAYHVLGKRAGARVAAAEGSVQRRQREVDTDAKIRAAMDAADYTLAKQLRAEQKVRYARQVANAGFLTPEQRKLVIDKFGRRAKVREHQQKLKGAQSVLGERYYEARKTTLEPPAASPFLSDRPRDPMMLQALRGRFAEARADLKDVQDRLSKGKIVPQGYTAEMVEAAVQQIRSALTPDEWAIANSHASALFDFNRKILDYYFSEGIISKPIHEALVGRGDHYVPLIRLRADLVSTPGWGTSSLLSLPTRRYLQHFEGSELNTLRPYEASALAAVRAVSDVAQNQAARSVIALHELVRGTSGEALTGFRRLREGDTIPEGASSISVWRDGKKQRWVVPKEVAIIQAAAKDPGVVNLALRFTQGLLRFGTVGGNVAFSVYNIPRDIHETVALARTSRSAPLGLRTAAVISSWVDTLFRDVIPKSPAYWDALWDGAMITRQRRMTPEAYSLTEARALTGSPKQHLNRLLKVLAYVSNVTEEASKVAGYKRAREAYGRKLGAYETRENVGTPNISAHGTAMDEANVLFMFLNVNVQGKARMWRRLKQDPAKVVVPLATSAILTAALFFKFNMQYTDDEGRPELEHVPTSDRKDFHVLFFPDSIRALGVDPIDPITGRRRYWKSRKGDVQQIFHNIAENALWAAAMQTKPDWIQFGSDLASQAVIPGASSIQVRPVPGAPVSAGTVAGSAVTSATAQLNPLARIPIEQMLNRNLYTGSPIETRAETNLSPELRYDPRTSPLAVVFGQATGISPKRAEHVFRSGLGGLSEELLSILDPAAQPFSPQTRPAREGALRVPFLSSIYKRIVGGRRDQIRENLADKFYDRQQELTRIVKGDVPHLISGNPQELQAYFARHDISGINEVLMLQAESAELDKMSAGISEVYARIRAAKTDEEARVLNKEILRLYRLAERQIDLSAGLRKTLRVQSRSAFGK
jgi:hypothetical protein